MNGIFTTLDIEYMQECFHFRNYTREGYGTPRDHQLKLLMEKMGERIIDSYRKCPEGYTYLKLDLGSCSKYVRDPRRSHVKRGAKLSQYVYKSKPLDWRCPFCRTPLREGLIIKNNYTCFNCKRLVLVTERDMEKH